jgi:tRNA(Ile)-lysidine synthase
MNDGNLRSNELCFSLSVVEQEVATRWPPGVWVGTRMLVAVSGGADSVALLHSLVRLSRAQATNTGISLIDVAHYNHGWRGAASDADQAFVRELCQRLGVRLFEGADLSGLSGPANKSEERAREVRYQFLTDTAYACGARYVVTGHTANDRVETVLHNLFRGTGLSGVAGPALTRQLDRDLVLIRPLVGCWREQIEGYLGELGEAYRQDASNVDITYRRNYLRHSLMPILRREYGVQVDQRLCSFSELAEETMAALRDSAEEYLRLVEALRRDAGLVGDLDAAWVPSLGQLNFPWVVVREGLRNVWLARQWKLQAMTREHWEALRSLLQPRKPAPRTAVKKLATLNLPDGLIAVHEEDWIRIGR